MKRVTTKIKLSTSGEMRNPQTDESRERTKEERERDRVERIAEVFVRFYGPAIEELEKR